MSEFISVVAEQMQQYGIIPPDSFVVDGNIHRFPASGKSKHNCWYALHYFRLDNGTDIVTGRFGDWRTGLDAVVKLNLPVLSADEKRRFVERVKSLKAGAERARKEKAAEAASRAKKIWSGLPDSGRSDYLDNKKVRAFGLRFSRGSVVVPLMNMQREILGLQFIKPDGQKTFLTGTAKKGAFHFIGTLDKDKPLLFAEGYATAASLHMALGLPVVVCFDAGNLKPVVRVWRNALKHQHFVVCGDNDHKTKGNPGLTKAKAAAAAVGGEVLIPQVNAAREGVHDA